MQVCHQTECVQIHCIPDAMCWMLLLVLPCHAQNYVLKCMSEGSVSVTTTRAFLNTSPAHCWTSWCVPIHSISFATSRPNDWIECYANWRNRGSVPDFFSFLSHNVCVGFGHQSASKSTDTGGFSKTDKNERRSTSTLRIQSCDS